MPSTTTANSKRRGSEAAAAANSAEGKSLVAGVAALTNGKILKAEDFQVNHDLFLNAMQKPTQIYKTLRDRMIYSPLFLQRTLWYMRHRMSRSNKSRKDFRIKDMLDKKLKKECEKKEGGIGTGTGGNKDMAKAKNFYNIIFLGFSDGNIWAASTVATVDIIIGKVHQKKRKEANVFESTFKGTSQVRVYRDENDVCKHKCGAISIPSDLLSIENGHKAHQYVLYVKVSISKSSLLATNNNNNNNNQVQNNENGPSSSSNNSNNTGNGNGNGNHEDITEEPKQKRRRTGSMGMGPLKENLVKDDEQISYVGYTDLYNEKANIQLDNNDFEVILDKMSNRSRNTSFSLNALGKHNTRWVTLNKNDQNVENFNKIESVEENKARLKIALRASAAKIENTIDPPLPNKSTANGLQDDPENENLRVIYQFLYQNNTRQETNAQCDLRCPWCSLDCGRLVCLLKHLILCHPRFNFIFSPIPNERAARIDVSLNESFDGSYTGSAYDLVAQPPGEAFARNGPTKRTRVFAILVLKPNRQPLTLNEFLDNEEKETDPRRTYITGHNRLYHHTTTCLPIHPKEIDVDSEGENDPEWLKVKTSTMIDEFTDVNEGEKELMKLWNMHMLKYNYVGDCQIPLACKMFVELQGKEIIRKNLYRNFLLHLTNLYDYGLLSPHGIYKNVQLLQTQMKETNSVNNLRASWMAQVKVKNNSLNFKDTVNSLSDTKSLENTA